MENKLAQYRAQKGRASKGLNTEKYDEKLNDEFESQDARIWSNQDSYSAKFELSCVGNFFQNLYSFNGILKAALWFSLWMFFVKIECGAVYFVISLILILYFSMKDSERGDGELSAYSVFNKNFERLDGTFTAEQFDNQIRRGGGLR